jgi:hypothetical protein
MGVREGRLVRALVAVQEHVREHGAQADAGSAVAGTGAELGKWRAALVAGAALEREYAGSDAEAGQECGTRASAAGAGPALARRRAIGASSSARSGLSARVEQRVRGRAERSTGARTGRQRGSCGVQVG